MGERIWWQLTTWFKRLRPLLLLVLAVNLAILAQQFEQIYLPKPDPPLVRLVAAGKAGPESQLPVRASITGAVAKPGVYEFPGDASPIINDLLLAAGGTSKTADTAWLAKEINLAQSLEPGTHLYIPTSDEQKLLASQSQTAVPGRPAAGQAAAQGQVRKINLNTATTEELQQLPGVGESTAAKIIAARPFTKVEDLDNVAGIGTVTFNKLKDLVTV